MGKVYFVNAVGTDLFKVGFTAGDTRARIRSLQTACPYDLEVYDTIIHPDAQAIEREIHQKLSGYHRRGEWFEVDRNVIDRVIAEYSDTGSPWVQLTDGQACVIVNVETEKVYVRLSDMPPFKAMIYMGTSRQVIMFDDDEACIELEEIEQDEPQHAGEWAALRSRVLRQARRYCAEQRSRFGAARPERP